MWFVLPHLYPLVQYDVYSQEPQLHVEPLAGECAAGPGRVCAPRTGQPRPELLSSGQVRKLGGVGVSRLVNPTRHLTCQTLGSESLGLLGRVGCIYLARFFHLRRNSRKALYF